MSVDIWMLRTKYMFIFVLYELQFELLRVLDCMQDDTHRNHYYSPFRLQRNET